MNFYKKIVNVLLELNKSNPKHNLGKHIATSVDSSTTTSDLWGMSDEELYNSLRNYQLSMEMDVHHDESEIDKIVRDGLRLGQILESGEDEYYEEY